MLNRSSILSIESDYIECGRQIFIYLNETFLHLYKEIHHVKG